MEWYDAYTKWLNDFASDAQTVEELKQLDDKELEDRFYTELSFGTGGMRGVIGAGLNRMNIYNIRRASKGLAQYVCAQGLADRGVVIAYDSRRFSNVFAKQAALTLAASGIKAYLFDSLRPVPVLSYAVRHLNTAAGVIITASHNPPQYNGYKVYAEDGAQLAPEAADEVTRYIRALEFTDCVPMDEQEALDKGLLQIISSKEVDDDYIAMIKSLALRPEMLEKEGKDLSIVYTPLHGSGLVPVSRMLRELGVTKVAIVPEQEKPDPDFPTVTAPNPEDPAAFKYAIPLAEKVGATVVFGTDPDCDRMGIAVKDKEGVFHTLTGNQIGCLLLSHILESKKNAGTLPANGAVVKSIVSTELARKICEAYGVQMYDVLTGFKFIGEKIQQFEETGSNTFLFGFEESYGFLSGTAVRDKDGVNASLLLCEAVCAAKVEGVTLYEKLNALFERFGYYIEKGVSVVLPGKDGVQKMKDIMDNLRVHTPTAIGPLKVTAVRDYLKLVRTDANGSTTKLDTPESNVLYFELENGCWVCIRPSGTEPKIKLYIATCASTKDASEDMNRLLAEGAQELLK